MKTPLTLSRLKQTVFIVLLIASRLTICNAQSSELTENEIVKLRPKGYILFTEAAAREALKDRYDATALSQIVTLKDSIIITKDAIILRLSQQVIEGKALQRQIFWLNLERWALRLAVVFVTYKWANK